MRVGAAQNGEEEGARYGQIVGELGLAREQCRIFTPQHGRADDGRRAFFGDAHHVTQPGFGRSRRRGPP